MEIFNVFFMVIKIGVLLIKFIIGIISYGWFFWMVDLFCIGFMCIFIGVFFGVKFGCCICIVGYFVNIEIQEILYYDKLLCIYYDEGIMSDILVYGFDWVVDMNNNNKGCWEVLWKLMNFGGVLDWVIGFVEFLFNDVFQVLLLLMEEIKEDWVNIICKYFYVRNSSYRQFDCWKIFKVDEVWKYVVGKWDVCVKFGMFFFVFVSCFFNGFDGMYCGLIFFINNCFVIVECSDEFECWLVVVFFLSLFVKFVGIYYELYDGI